MAKKQLPPILKEIKKYIPINLDYSSQKTISYSQFSTFVSCNKKWELQYRDGNYIPSPSIHTVFGTALHETLQHYMTVMYSESGVKADEIDINEYFEEKLRVKYAEEYKNNNKTHFSNPIELREFFEDGINILDFFKKKRKTYFGKKDWYLVGVELPILLSPNNTYYNVYYKGYLDLVLYHEPTNKFVIYDIKTSTNGWRDKEKSDEIKQFQLILYKQFFSEQFKVPIENIDVEFFILKRKIFENSEYPQSRIQQYSPASGKNKTAKSRKMLNEFIETVFNLDGTYKKGEYTPNPTKFNCTYCPFSKNNMCSFGKVALG